MIKRLFLPYNPMLSHLPIDRPSRSALYSLHDSAQGKDFFSLLVDERSADEVYVVRHYDRDIEFVSLPMVVATRCQHKISCCRRQGSTELRDKGDEVGREVFLQMRQVAAVELHEKIVP